MLFHSNRDGGPGAQDVWVARRNDVTGTWSPPTPLGSVNTAGTELRGWMSPCGLELYFQADRGGGTEMDFFVARRASTDQAFGSEQRIEELSSGVYDQDLRLSVDRRHAVFASGRTGNGDLYESYR